MYGISGKKKNPAAHGEFFRFFQGHGIKSLFRNALDFASDSRRKNGRILMICNHFYNEEAGVKDKQNGIIIFFRGPYVDDKINDRMKGGLYPFFLTIDHSAK